MATALRKARRATAPRKARRATARTAPAPRAAKTPQGLFVVVKHPADHQFYRFGEVEDFILQSLDGATPLDEVRRRTESRFGAALGDDALALFVRKLSNGDLLETNGSTPRIHYQR